MPYKIASKYHSKLHNPMGFTRYTTNYMNKP